MALQRFEVGLVSADRTLVDFLAEVFDLEELPTMTAGPGALHRLQLPGGAVLKVMVPNEKPAAAETPEPFFAAAGIRYLTLYVDDLDRVVARATARKGRIQHGPQDLAPGVRIAVLRDPDGNAIEVVEKKG
jgi:catechol 2,3-dioxygenase-like lactoylglutathione lyase family enzyme